MTARVLRQSAFVYRQSVLRPPAVQVSLDFACVKGCIGPDDFCAKHGARPKGENPCTPIAATPAPI
ncbi:MAG: hypothetical protein K9G71_11895 [Rhodobacteraceae bacterium]|nr:hypothetical protein [Paracoccaceae bacterium]MCF8519299.1 hypothetical protein [Paracoccaceae bacterium]